VGPRAHLNYRTGRERISDQSGLSVRSKKDSGLAGREISRPFFLPRDGSRYRDRGKRSTFPLSRPGRAGRLMETGVTGDNRLARILSHRHRGIWRACIRPPAPLLAYITPGQYQPCQPSNRGRPGPAGRIRETNARWGIPGPLAAAADQGTSAAVTDASPPGRR